MPQRLRVILGHLTGISPEPTASLSDKTDMGDTGCLVIKTNCLYDEVSAGEVMLRFDPTPMPTKRARTMRVFHGGGETNVAEGLSACFGLKTAVVTALVDDGVGRNIELQMKESGVDTDHFIWFNTKGEGKFSTDGKGTLHNGVNFTFAGFGVLPAVTEYYRAHTPIMEVGPGDVDWDSIFAKGVRWFHTGGIYTLLSDKAAASAEAALVSAGKHGTIRSFDLNYRSKVQPNKEKAQATNKKLMHLIDIVGGNQDDFEEALGFETEKVAKDASFDTWLAVYTKMMERVAAEYPNVQYIATQLRGAISANMINWSAVLYETKTKTVYRATPRERIEILDRVGGGDSFMSGMIAGFLRGKGPQGAVDWGAAHGILAQETPGDVTMVDQAQVEAEVKRASKGGGVSALR